MAPLFDYSPPQTILLSRTSMSPPSRTIFNAYRTTSLWPGIDTPRPRRNRQCMLTGNDGRNRIPYQPTTVGFLERLIYQPLLNSLLRTLLQLLPKFQLPGLVLAVHRVNV